jgi:hypothetical protein
LFIHNTSFKHLWIIALVEMMQDFEFTFCSLVIHI